MNARFNGLYLAKVQLNESLKNLRDNHPDDFTQILSVFPYGTSDQRASEKGNLEEVYKKCSNVIKKHPKSKWVDDSRYLIGQAYLYQNDPISAIETFQYVIGQFPDGEKKYDAKLGILMAYIAQEKYYDAEAIMSILKKEGKFPKRLEKDFSTIAAEIYIKQGKYIQAIEELEKALPLTKLRDDKSRYNFILAQLYLKNSEIEKSKERYIRTIKLNPPYELAFQSNLGLIKTIGMSSEKSLKTPRKYLKKMLNDDKNIEYHDQIYYELANLEMQAGNIDEAIANYKMSAKSSVKNQDQKANSYLALATLYFDRKEYTESQKYFDSTAMFMSSSRPDYENIKAKQSVLTDLIENLITIYEQDSLIELSKLPREELDKKVNAQIARDVRQKELEEERKNQNLPIVDAHDPFNNQPNKVNNNALVGGSWYFYNQSAIARGTNDFKRKWGNRKKSDLWRYTSLQAALTDDPQIDDGDEDTTEVENPDLAYDKSQDKENEEILKGIDEKKRSYYKDIPFSEESKEAALAKVEDALFNTGKIYFEDLKELSKASGYLKTLLKRFPSGKNEPETYFILNKIENELGNTSEASSYADMLNSKYPNNPFNLVLNNKEEALELSSDNEIGRLYQEAYTAYKNDQFEKALDIRTKANEKFAGNSLQSKFDYLEALIIGKTKGKAEYIDRLKRIVELYPGTEVANKADYTIALFQEQNSSNELEDVANSSYKLTPEEEHYFVTIYDGVNEQAVQTGFSDYNKKNHGLENLRVNAYALDKKNVVAIQSFKNKDEAEKYYIEFIKSDKFFKNLGIRAYDIYTISKSNFRTLLSERNIDAYALFFVRNYIQ